MALSVYEAMREGVRNEGASINYTIREICEGKLMKHKKEIFVELSKCVCTRSCGMRCDTVKLGLIIFALGILV